MNPLQFYARPEGRLDFGNGPNYGLVLEACRDVGFTAVQVERAFVKDAEDWRQVARGLTPAPLYVSGCLAEPTCHDAVASAFGKALDLTTSLGLDAIVLADELTGARIASAGRHAGEKVDATGIEAMAKGATRMARMAADVGVRVCVHPHVGTCLESAEEIDAFVEAIVPGIVTLCVDTGHLAWGGVKDIREWLTQHTALTGMLHVKDVNLEVVERGVRAAVPYAAFVRDGLWREPGRGDLDLAGVLADFRGSAIWAVVEVDAPHGVDSTESIRISAAFMAAYSQEHR